MAHIFTTIVTTENGTDTVEVTAPTSGQAFADLEAGLVSVVNAADKGYYLSASLTADSDTGTVAKSFVGYAKSDLQLVVAHSVSCNCS